ncbi:MAG TPA: molybdate ABC transporter substrate-binding protein [Bacillota bacterium]|nr:molybdate ABC transporter substrate-binding protein [Bacillota bacterium]
MKFLLAILMLLLLFSGCQQHANEEASDQQNKDTEETIELTVSAAVSLTDALEDIKDIYEQENNVKLTFNLGGSGKLAQQIQQGAPVDLFISANQDWMDTLEKEDLIVPETRTDITGNSIVLIANQSAPFSISSMDAIDPQDIEKIAIGNPDSVPAGKYAQQVLQKAQLLDELEEKFVLAKDVRQVLTYVKTGNADIGFVYESDARTSENIQIITRAKQDDHDPIIYPGAVIKDSEYQKEARDFMTFIESKVAQDILESYGFEK